MKKITSILTGIIMGLNIMSAQAKEIKLPTPNLRGGKPLMQVMSTRQSIREYAKDELSIQTISEILWSAWGITHDGKHTIPTSMNRQNLNVYLLNKEGSWKYNPEKHTLSLLNNKDLRPLLHSQDYVKDAPIHLVYTGSDPKNSPLHAGSSYQNVGLYCASENLSCVVRGYFNAEELQKALNLPTEEKVIITLAAGKQK